MEMLGLSFKNPESIFYKSYRQQLLVTLKINLISFSHGLAAGWVAPMLLWLQTFDSPLSFIISVHEASWMGSLISLGGLFGNIIIGILINWIGRKKCIYLLAVPHIP